jgi:signal transduction histidine kinase
MNRLLAGVHRPSAYWWVAAVALYGVFAIDLVGHLTQPNVTQTTGVWVFLDTKVAALIAAGLWIWGWRVRRIGLLLLGWAVCVLAIDLMNVYPDSRLVATVGLLLWASGFSFAFHAAFAYPTGNLEHHWPTRVFVFGAMYAVGFIIVIPWLLFQHGPWPRATSYLYVGHTVSWLGEWNRWALGWTWIATLPFFLWLLWRRFRATSRGGRRTIWPFLTATLLAMVVSQAINAQWLLSPSWTLDPYSSYADVLAGWLMVLGAVFGVLVTRRARGVVGDLVVDLGRARPGGVRDGLARAIGDPTLELALWVPQKNGWVDEQGRDVELPVGPDRAVTLIGDKLAAIVHDPVLLDQPALLEAAGSAARFALENERLEAELRAQLTELRESRARIVRAGDEERRRLERDLHDGAQQRLLGLGMGLQLLRPHVTDQEGAALLENTEGELQQAVAELRELARGIHPAVLTEHGLGDAVRTLAARAPLPVKVDGCGGRMPEPVETAAYFVVSEALTNIAKYAHATKAEIRIDRNNGSAHIEVHDNGVGGANPHDGSGLNGLADRIAALNGQLRIDSPTGAGTTITADIPCTP